MYVYISCKVWCCDQHNKDIRNFTIKNIKNKPLILPIMYIDPHVHCRDGTQAYKETIKHALSVAARAGMTAVFDMPNTVPPILTKQQAVDRINLAKKSKSPVFYGLYMGLTSDPDQVAQAVQTYNELPNVIGFKLYAGHSVGKMGVTEEIDQKQIYRTLTKHNYTGVVAVHCEKEGLMKPELWDPAQPVTHAAARPPQAEVASLNDQISFARAAQFSGTLHIAHISVPESVDIIHEHKKIMNITCGVCPHHCVLDSTMLERSNGLIFKMNPPLRMKTMAQQMFDYLKEGKIDWIETDHAPHTLQEKLHKPHMSGTPGLPFYPRFILMLKKTCDSQFVKNITFNNIVKTFKLNLQPRECVPELNLASEYELNPYENVKV
jgi:dihydroorotase